MADDEREKTDKTTQTYAALGVGFVCVIIGLPLWWKTTEVYRVELPYSDITSLADAQVEYAVDMTVIVFGNTYSGSDLSSFSEKLRKHFEESEKIQDHFQPQGEPRSKLRCKYLGNVRRAFDEEKDALERAKSLVEFDESLEKIRVLKEHGKYTVAVLPVSSKLIPQKGKVGSHRVAFLPVDSDLGDLVPQISYLMKEVLVNEVSLHETLKSAQSARHLKTDKASMRAVRSTPGYDVTFTLYNPQPDILNARWGIEGAVKDYLTSILHSFSPFVDINVKSQYLYYTKLYMKPTRSKDKHFYLRAEDLPHIINPIEGHLSSHVSNNPHLNFIVYIPTRDQTPLYIYDDTGKPASNNAFLSPRWGGILIYNVPPLNESTPLPAPVDVDVKVAMEVFLSQLRLLLGVDTQVSQYNIPLTQPGNEGILGWELDLWLAKKTLENIASSTATLTSLIQLLEEVKNIVINDAVGREVQQAVEAIKKSQAFLAKNKLKEAYHASKQAIMSSEKAFFDPSLLELLYFPEDQKFAIYIPLFLPISIPVILSLLQAFKWIKAQRKKTTKAD